ncbi:hypothetical protein JGUZn3_17950 [Entomobacter blattae]|uniref:Uncharacterized protein n=1 Tax=Entomobacter blattae TaxID=2762277 RepID=A0A7H1NTA0_9PROT|nr:hypothetical protein JGUZn3_17950 [Entomobacter blattae]
MANDTGYKKRLSENTVCIPSTNPYQPKNNRNVLERVSLNESDDISWHITKPYITYPLKALKPLRNYCAIYSMAIYDINVKRTPIKG